MVMKGIDNSRGSLSSASRTISRGTECRRRPPIWRHSTPHFLTASAALGSTRCEDGWASQRGTMRSFTRPAARRAPAFKTGLLVQIVGASVTNNVTGWTADGGVEWMPFPNWSLKVEYLFVQFPTTSDPFNTALPGGAMSDLSPKCAV